MADVTRYKRQIQEASSGDEVKPVVIDAFTAINKDGPSAVTFYGLQQDAYVKRALSPMDTTPDTLDARAAALIQKIKKIDIPTDSIWVDDPTLLKLYSDMILNTKGFRKIIGNLGAYPKS